MKTMPCPHCGGTVAKSAKQCPHCGGKKGADAISSTASAIKAVFVIAIVFPIAYTCSQGYYGDDMTASTSGSDSSSSAQPSPEPQKDLAKWHNRSYTDEMSGKVATTATVESTNVLNLSFPHQGAQRAKLTFRDHPRYGKDVILALDSGQFTCGVRDCDVVVRWGNWDPLTLKASKPSDGSSDTLFFRNYSRFLANSHRVDEVRIRLPLYQQGEQFARFDLSKMTWAR